MHLYFTRKCTCHTSCSGGSFFTKAPGLILVDACCTKFNAINRPPPPSSAPHIQKICHSLLYLACTRLSGAMRMTINFWFFICLRRLNASNVGLRPPLPSELYLLINIILDTPLCIYNSFLLRSGRCFYLYTFSYTKSQHVSCFACCVAFFLLSAFSLERAHRPRRHAWCCA